MQFMAKRSWTGQSQGESQVNMLRQEARAKKPQRTQGILSCAKVSTQVKLMVKASCFPLGHVPPKA